MHVLQCIFFETEYEENCGSENCAKKKKSKKKKKLKKKKTVYP